MLPHVQWLLLWRCWENRLIELNEDSKTVYLQPGKIEPDDEFKTRTEQILESITKYTAAPMVSPSQMMLKQKLQSIVSDQILLDYAKVGDSWPSKVLNKIYEKKYTSKRSHPAYIVAACRSTNANETNTHKSYYYDWKGQHLY